MPVWWNWQTCWTQNPVVAIPYRFDPGHRHQSAHTLVGRLFRQLRKISSLVLNHRPKSRELNKTRAGNTALWCRWIDILACHARYAGSSPARVANMVLWYNGLLCRTVYPKTGVQFPVEPPFSSSLTGKRHTYNMKTQEHYLTDRVDNYYWN